jgi:hypothetical protein
MPPNPSQQQHDVVFVSGLATPSSSPEYLMPKRSLQPVIQHRTTSQPHSLVNSHPYDATSTTSPPAIPTCATTAAALLRQKILGYHQEGPSLSTTTVTTATPATTASL